MFDRLRELLAGVHPGLTLRAECDGDENFLRELYASTRAGELAVLDWTPAEKRAFLDQQFFAQRTHYRRHYPDALFLVVIHEDVSIGRVYIDLGSSELRLMDIALLPACRRRGLGAALVSAVVGLSIEVGVEVTLHVEPLNPALAWYERLGFEKLERRGAYWFMRLAENRLRQAQEKLI